jgi:hypothetical protein
MPSNPELEAAKRRWAETAQGLLEELTDGVAALRGAFESGNPSKAELPEGVASNIVSASAKVIDWLGTSRAPRGLGKAEGEIAATSGVYRNAAVAFESLSDANPDQYAARCAACANLLEQGDHHVENFVSLLRRKLEEAP